jgi:HAD superfamily hydrolase (TIGR01509 family)
LLLIVSSEGVDMLTIFDCDGTLIDSERPVADICLAAIHELGLKGWTMEKYVSTFVGMPGPVGWSHVERELGRRLPEGYNDVIDSRIHAEFKRNLKAVPAAREAILATAGKRCVASSTAEPHLSVNLETAGLLDLFPSAVFSASQVARAKPAPDVFLLAVAKMGEDPSNTIVIEDSVPGVLAAKRAGMRAIGFVGTAHDPQQLGAALREAGALTIIEHLQSVPSELARLRQGV